MTDAAPSPQGPRSAAALSAPLAATLMMIGALAAFSCMGGLIRLASADVHSLQIVFFRNLLAIPFFLPLLLRHGLGGLRTTRFGLHALRAVNGSVSMAAFFTAVTLIPLAEATALGFAAPLFATVAAVLFLGERIRAHRTAALALGAVGVLVILQPGLEGVSLGAALALLGALGIGLAAVMVKRLTATDRPDAIALWMVLLQAPLTLPAALWVWTWPSLETFAILVALAGSGTVGHVLWTRATALAEVTQLQPLEFLKLPLIATIGYFAFGETPHPAVWLGGALIFAGAAVATHREARLARARRAAHAAPMSAPLGGEVRHALPERQAREDAAAEPDVHQAARH